MLRFSPEMNDRAGGRDIAAGCFAVAVACEDNDSILRFSWNDYMHKYLRGTARVERPWVTLVM